MSKDIVDFLSKGSFLNIFKSIPEAIIVCDQEFKIVMVNNAMVKLYHGLETSIIGKKFDAIIKNTSGVICPICNEDRKVQKIADENLAHQATFVDLNGKETLVRICHGLDETNKLYINILTPLSDLVCLDQAQVDFVSTVSHELRTPMTSIKGFADTLLSSGDKLSQEQQTRFISIIKSQADRLTRLVENLLTVSRLETKSHKSVFRPLNLQFYIDRIIMSLKSKFPNHKFVTVLADNLPTVWADQDKLEQVLTNLLDNAAKYSPESSTVNVKVGIMPEDMNKVEINVIDQGIGIPEEHIPKIFNKFSRIDNPLTRQVQGTGLGLYITKALVESMKGSIKVTSSNQGTTFTVTLLVATPEIQAKQSLIEV